MYSVILVAALASAPAVPGPIFNRVQAGGCSGVVGGRFQPFDGRFRLRHRRHQSSKTVAVGPVAKAGVVCDFNPDRPPGFKALPVGDFKAGDKVSHSADPKGRFPAGTGVVIQVIDSRDQKPVYSVRCDKTGMVLHHLFKASELKPYAKKVSVLPAGYQAVNWETDKQTPARYSAIKQAMLEISRERAQDGGAFSSNVSDVAEDYAWHCDGKTCRLVRIP